MCTAQVVLMASVAYPAATFPLVLPHRNFLPVLKIVTHTALVAYKLLLLSVHVTSVLFLVQLNNFAPNTGLHALTQVARSYALLLLAEVPNGAVVWYSLSVSYMCM